MMICYHMLMEIDIDNLPKTEHQLKDIILYLHQSLHKNQDELARYKEKYHGLIEELRLAKQRRFSPSSEKNILQLDLFDEAGINISEEVRDQLAEKVDVKSYTRKKHPTRRPLPSYLPREVILHDIPELEKICTCGQHLVRIGEEISEQLKYLPAKISVIQHVRPKYACKPCQEQVKIAPMPSLLLPKSIATPELVAHTIVTKYCDHIPLYRQEAMWERMDIDMPRSSLCGWVIKTAQLCEPLIKHLKSLIVNYDYAQVDETTIQVLNETGRDNKTSSYMWCYRGGGKNACIVFDYQETRGGYHAQQFLSEFQGYLQSDAFSGYNWAHHKENVMPVGCHAHARRPFAEVAKLHHTQGLAKEALRFYQQLYAIEKEAKNNKLSAEQRYQLRNDKACLILNVFKTWLDHHLTKTSEQSKIGKAIRYCIAHWIELNNYLKDGRIEIDNNLIENAIRPFAIGRKNWLFAGSPSGAKAGATLYSLIETCKANSIEPYHYFCSMLSRIRECKTEDDYLALIPQNIKI
jgi:transposase